MVDPTPKPKRLYRNYLLNRRLQLGYALAVLLMSAAIATALGVLIYQQSALASDQILAGMNVDGMEWIDPQTREQVSQALTCRQLAFAVLLLDTFWPAAQLSFLVPLL